MNKTLTIALVILGCAVPLSLFALTLTGNIFFSGNVVVTGALSKGSGTFVIDHPLDPKNKLLYHSFVESPDVKNIYDGIAVLDENGSAVIVLPDYFEALNTDYRYQYTPLSGPMPNLFVMQKVQNNQFALGGGSPFGSVSWQITGTRHDPYIIANPIVNEVNKGPDKDVDRGECLFEPLCQ